MKVVGVKHNVGTFDDPKTGKAINFDSYQVFCTEDVIDESMQFGVCPKVIKVKAAVLYQIVAPDKINKLIDRNLEFYYDAYRNVSKIEVL